MVHTVHLDVSEFWLTGRFKICCMSVQVFCAQKGVGNLFYSVACLPFKTSFPLHFPETIMFYLTPWCSFIAKCHRFAVPSMPLTLTDLGANLHSEGPPFRKVRFRVRFRFRVRCLEWLRVTTIYSFSSLKNFFCQFQSETEVLYSTVWFWLSWRSLKRFASCNFQQDDVLSPLPSVKQSKNQPALPTPCANIWRTEENR